VDDIAGGARDDPDRGRRGRVHRDLHDVTDLPDRSLGALSFSVGQARVKIPTKILRDSRGFTLIELMLAIIIIGVLVAMVAPRLAGKSQQATEAVARADINANLRSEEHTSELQSPDHL